MVPRPSNRFPWILKHAHGSPLRMINHLLRSPRLKAGATRGIPVLRMVTPARAPADVYGCRTRRDSVEGVGCHNVYGPNGLHEWPRKGSSSNLPQGCQCLR
jgi:hypothetical protein